MRETTQSYRPFFPAAIAMAVSILAGCVSAPMPSPQAPAPAPVSAAPAATPVTPRVAAPPAFMSNAATPKDYRRDAAGHLYARNSDRIFKGKLQPLLYAVGVFEVEIDNRGQVTSTNWLRAPTHAPEVMAEIERLVRQVAPYPAPARMGRVTYTDTWLWDKSGRFQLDTLTEGQL
jgi:periplasmic protein TonB